MYPENTNQNAVRSAVGYDAGLRSYFQRIYNTMALGLVITGLVAWGVAATPALVQAIFGSRLTAFIVAFAPLGFLLFGFSPGRIQRQSVAQLTSLFYVFSAVFGLSMASVFLVYSGESIARVFFITAAMFAGTSVYGYLTKKDLSSLGSLMIMGAWGIFIALLVNIFLKSAMVYFVTSIMGVIVYTGLTAWDTQNLKRMYSAANGAEANGKMAVMGALSLYINFLNLFMFLLRLMGNNRN